MKKKLNENIVKGWITSIMGLIIYVITTLFIWKGNFDFLWEGVGGYVLGTTLLLFPRSIEKFIMKYLDKEETIKTKEDEQVKPNGE